MTTRRDHRSWMLSVFGQALLGFSRIKINILENLHRQVFHKDELDLSPSMQEAAARGSRAIAEDPKNFGTHMVAQLEREHQKQPPHTWI